MALAGRSASRLSFGLWLLVVILWSRIGAAAHDEWVLFILAHAIGFQAIRRLHDLGMSGWWYPASCSPLAC